MDDREFLAARFEAQRSRLRSVAFRILGSTAEADDAVQEAWIRLDRTDTTDVENLAGWLTTVVARISLNMIRARMNRRDEPWDLHELAPGTGSGIDDPQQQALLADGVGLALMVVLDTLSPSERVAFVLHDVFGLPFEEIAPMIDKTTDAARQVASRARRRVHGSSVSAEADSVIKRRVVDAFFDAARNGSFEQLVALLDPDVVLTVEVAADVRHRIVGAANVAGRAVMFADPNRIVHPVTFDTTVGVAIVVNGTVTSLMAFAVEDGLVSAIDVINDPLQLEQIAPDLEHITVTWPW